MALLPVGNISSPRLLRCCNEQIPKVKRLLRSGLTFETVYSATASFYVALSRTTASANSRCLVRPT